MECADGVSGIFPVPAVFLSCQSRHVWRCGIRTPHGTVRSGRHFRHIGNTIYQPLDYSAFSLPAALEREEIVLQDN